MKTILLSFVLFFAAIFSTRAQITGACDIVSITTEFVSSQASTQFPGKCDVKINLSWEQRANNGNKFSYLHIWPASSYVPFTFTNPSNPPMANDLSTSVGTIVVGDPSSTSPKLLATYYPDPSYSNVLPLLNYPAITLSRTTANGIDRFTVKGVILAGITCSNNGVYSFVVDAWSSQQAHGKNVHCASQQNSFSINELIDRSQVSCGTNSTLELQLLSNTSATTGTLKVYADLNAYAQFDPATDANLTSQVFATSAAPSISGSWPYRYSSSIAIPSAYRQRSMWLQVVPNSGKATQIFLVSNGCAPLPENLASFTTVRVRNTVQLKWETVNEQNTKGFNVLRKTGGAWETVAFVPSPVGGNSSEKVAYSYNDNNTFSGVTQYQLAEITAQGRPKYSEIKAIKGENQTGKIMLFPNPTTNGSASLVFDNQAVRDISLMDATGRVIKELKSTASNNIGFENLQVGFYSVRIRVQATNEVFTEKLLVSKR